MPDQFDAYHKWLGIRPEEQPANHYRLLGITLFEDDIDAIAGAADQRMAHVRTYQLGKHSDLSQRILNELATAKTCLLKPEKKLEYDEQLQKKSKQSLLETIPVEPAAELDPTAFPAAISHTKRRKKAKVSPYRSTFRFIGSAIAGVLGLATAWQLNSYLNSSNPSARNKAQADHNQSAEVTSAVKENASKSPGPKKSTGQSGLPMLERSSDPSKSTASTKPVIEAKTSVDIPVTAEKPVIEKTLSQEAAELKAAFEAAQSTEDHQAVAEKGLALADRAIVEGNADLANSAIRTSLAAARKADNVALTKRATQLLMQMQNPLSDSIKDEARKRRGSEKHLTQAGEGLPAKSAATEGGIQLLGPDHGRDIDAKQALVSKFDDKALTNSIGMKLLWVPPGNFTMGSPNAENGHSADRESQVSVRISKGYYLGKYKVTQAEFKAVMNKTPWAGRVLKEESDFPATFVDWSEASEFCQKLNDHESQQGRLPKGYLYALPTEAQWEYACRAGTTTAYSFGDDPHDLSEYAWFDKNAALAGDRNAGFPGEEYAHKVGQKKPNPWGFYDMHGSVAEWCRDRFVGKLPGGTDPLTEDGWGRTLRRGRSAGRTKRLPSDRLSIVGFRLALVDPGSPVTAKDLAATAIVGKWTWRGSGVIAEFRADGSFQCSDIGGWTAKWVCLDKEQRIYQIEGRFTNRVSILPDGSLVVVDLDPKANGQTWTARRIAR